MNWSRTQRSRVACIAAGLVLVGLGLTGCTTNDTTVRAQAPDTVAITPVVPPSETAATVAPTAAPATEPSTTAPPVTDPPVTEPPVTEPPVTEPPVTEPPVTAPPIPSNIEVVGASSAPIEAVGGRSGPATAVVQLRLLQLGFWNEGADGNYGKTTQQAVMAFQKYLHLPTTGKVDADTAAWLQALDTKAHGQADTGTLVEVDKGNQLLFFIVDGKTQWVLNTSTATGQPYSEEDKNTPGEIQTGISITPDGLWKTNRERPEGWWEGDLGQIYRPKYFHGGVAVHGSNSIPDYPASHGCVRVSVQAMDWVWATNMMPLGITVWVHE
jgi:lipoprotein-anchoring transpeptidase ErfK/SrfK